VFLSTGNPAQVRLGRALSQRGAIGLTSLMVIVVPVRIATDSPLIPVMRDYSGEAAIPEWPHLEGTDTPPRRQDRFVVDL
jgi:hypothetical protein